MLLWSRAFLQLWVGAEYYAGAVPTLLITLMVTQFVLIRNDAAIIDLTLNLRRKVLIGALSATLSLIFAGVLVSSFKLGITGLCLGFMGGRSILSLGYPWLVSRFLGAPLAAQLKGVPRPAVVTILLFVLALSVGDWGQAGTWIGLAFSVGVTVVVVSLLAFYAGLSGDQRRRIMQRVQMVMRPVSKD